MMNIKTISVGPLETNCCIAWGDERRALVIDPGDEPAVILDFLDNAGLSVAAYALTHGHPDHISALAAVAAEKPAPVGMHQADAEWAFSATRPIPPICGITVRPVKITRTLEDGREWNDTGQKYTILGTPGHSPGGICLYFPEERVLFSGDTLFMSSVGRTDLPGGDHAVLCQSLAKLARLPGETIVYPGHGPATNIDAELDTNPFMADLAL